MATPWVLPLVVGLLAAIGHGAHAATPFVPQRDDEVVQRIDGDASQARRERNWRQQLQRQPQDEATALAYSRSLLQRARAEGDARLAGRALAALRGWPDAQQAPAAVALQRATILQHLHRFDEAAQLLEQLTRVHTTEPQAWLTLAGVRRVQGRLDASQQACAGLARTQQAPFHAQACDAENRGLMGDTARARATLQSLASDARASADQRAWVLVTWAELELRSGQVASAEPLLRRSLAMAPGDSYASIALADLLLARQGTAPALSALAVLSGLADSDAVLVRRAIAEQRVSAARGGKPDHTQRRRSTSHHTPRPPTAAEPPRSAQRAYQPSRSRTRRSASNTINVTATMTSWPNSMPRLNCSSAQAKLAVGRPPISSSAPAKPMPWISPKKKVTSARGTRKKGRTLSMAVATMVAAIKGSTMVDGTTSQCRLASARVTECASVNMVTRPSTGHSACCGRSMACQAVRCGPPPLRPTAGSNRQMRNSTWSRPPTMWWMPSRKKPDARTGARSDAGVAMPASLGVAAAGCGGCVGRGGCCGSSRASGGSPLSRSLRTITRWVGSSCASSV